ncbi:MAG TPA: signal recognition particle-docking protein FtsY [Dehalococcoidia bacterium]|nr:signal recognition particle-docking protein FtsY [Dehalococcoidia bacterium]
MRLFGRRAPRTGQALEQTRRAWFSRLGGIFQRGLDDSVWDELEETLLAADVGVATTEAILQRLRQRVRAQGVSGPDRALEALKEELVAILEVDGPRGQLWGREGPWPKPAVILVVGVNGSGKTTSIGKLAHAFRAQGLKVLLGAADTFRAAAIDQLRQWGERVGAEVVAHQQGADPAAVAFDAVAAGEARGADVVIIDTAGRLHTKSNLMEELRKVHRVVQRRVPSAPHEVLLVLDATTGQNALQQACYFTEAVGVTGVLLAKLDGSAKGGVVFPICHELGLPVLFVGTGEGPDDLAPFDPQEFVEALLAT